MNKANEMNEVITMDDMFEDGEIEIANKHLCDSQASLEKALAAIRNSTIKNTERIRIVEETTNARINETDNRVNKIQKEVNILGSPMHKRNLRHFKNIAIARVREILGNDKSTCWYVLFSRRFHKKIYADIAYKFQIASYGDIDMEDWKNSDSQFSQAKHMAETWLPAGCYVDEVVTELCNSDKNGLLSPQQHNALKQYLALTNNGKTNPFK